MGDKVIGIYSNLFVEYTKQSRGQASVRFLCSCCHFKAILYGRCLSICQSTEISEIVLLCKIEIVYMLYKFMHIYKLVRAYKNSICNIPFLNDTAMFIHVDRKKI